jgi:glycosyltransferase involved in cell wall biosynthesis
VDDERLSLMTRRPTIVLFADVLGGFGGIETYLDALTRRLHAESWPVRVAACLNGPAPFLEGLEQTGVRVYRQPRVPGDRWQVRQRLLIRHVAAHLKCGDWVFCVRQPMPEIYLSLARAVHARDAKLAASWAFAPEFLRPPPGRTGERFKRAIAETDAVISVAECTKRQFREIYGYDGPVKVVRYHNRELFAAPVALPSGPPYAIGFMGRIAIDHKNLDTILDAFRRLVTRRADVRLNFHGGGQDMELFRSMVAGAGVEDRVTLHGPYDHRRDLPGIIAANHLFVYTSRYEGGPCFALIELLQAGRFVVASPVGGIPDIYEGRPEIGDLVPPNDPAVIADAFERALTRIERGAIEPARIRAVYEAEFQEPVAHRQWVSALGLGDGACALDTASDADAILAGEAVAASLVRDRKRADA